MIVFYSTRRVIAIDKSTGKGLLFKNKKVLADFLGLASRNAVADWFRPVDGVKPTFKRYNNYEIYDIAGEYGERTAKFKDNIRKE